MDAVVLVGGEGTRLRPLTLERPKPVLPLLGRPLLAYVLERLAEAGVTRVIFGCGYLPDPIQACFGARALGLELEYVVEPRPMGTAGGIRHAARGRVSDTFLALNGDILADAPLAELVAAHRERGAVATIALTPVPDPSRYGLVRTEADGRVLGFLEKPEPEQIDTNLINAGAYVLEPGVLDLIADGQAVSIERETFPSLVGAGLFALAQPGYFSDVGTPESYIAAHHDLLGGRIRSGLPGLEDERALDRRRCDGLARRRHRGALLHRRRGRGRGGRAHRRGQLRRRRRRDRGERAAAAAPSCRNARGWGRAPSSAPRSSGRAPSSARARRSGRARSSGPASRFPAGAHVAEDERVFPEGGR